MSRIHSFDRAMAPETERLKRLIPDPTSGDTPAAGASAAQNMPMSPAEIQRANPPPTPPGVKREGVGGYVYPKSFEVL